MAGSSHQVAWIGRFTSGTLRGGGEVVTLKGHQDAVTCVAFSPDGKLLLVEQLKTSNS
jgi:WD40 repeat protein